jgi:two-component system sensor histidine kinase UhpB
MSSTAIHPHDERRGRPITSARSSSRLLRSVAARRLLRTPLFHKLFLANAVFLLLLGSGAILLTSRTVTILGLDPVLAIELLAVAVLGLSALANAVLIRLALSPLSGLEEAARRVREGDLRARAPASPLADEHLGRVIELFNEALDWAEADRARRTELSLRVLQAEERERERLGRELFAGTAQTLAGVLVRMRVAQRIRDVEQGVTLLEEVRAEVAQALDDVRRMARRLHPPELAEIGVAAALEAHARYLCEDHGMQARFLGKIPESRLSRESDLVLFRIVQEAISNAILHSGGSCVRVSFESTPDGLATEVEDDGSGFNPERTLFSGEGGLGLLGMRERAGYVSATLQIDSAPGAGTRVRLVIPWARTERGRAPDGRAEPLRPDVPVRERAFRPTEAREVACTRRSWFRWMDRPSPRPHFRTP